MAFLTVTIYAQKEVTKFLGIPVDGYKSEMKQKLISKGFVPKKVGNNEFLEGEFNGTDVNVYICTNNNKVYRIMLCDAYTRSEADIKIRFNKLVSQFMNNKRYRGSEDYTIPESESIPYEMGYNKKRYEAIFYQLSDNNTVDIDMQKQIQNEMLKKYTMEQIENPTEEIKMEMVSMAFKIYGEIIIKKPVWFRICECNGEYYIAMYYDNEFNQANGEDL